MADRPTAPRLDVLIDRACRHLTPAESAALREEVAVLQQRATALDCMEQDRTKERDHARTVAVALEQENARLEEQLADTCEDGARAEQQAAQVRALAERWRYTSDRKGGPLRELLAALDAAGQPDTAGGEQPVEGVRIPLSGIPECGADCPCRRAPSR